MKLGVDIDGTIGAWDELAAKLINYYHPEVSEIEVLRFYERNERDLIRELLDEVKANLDVCRLLKPYDGAASALRMLNNRGVEIVYITARDKSLWSITQRWLLHHNFPRWSNVFLGCEDKSSVVNSLRLGYFIEDRSRHIDALTKNTGSKLLAPKRIWNHYNGIPQFEYEGVFIFEHWSQVLEYFKREGVYNE